MGRRPGDAQGDGAGVKGRRPDTNLVHGGRRPEWRGRLVNPPVHRASTILFDSVAELRAAAPEFGKPYYGLHGTPTQWALSEALTELEPGAAGTMLYSSGLAAVTAALLSVLSAGDELLMTDSVYGPTRRFCDGFLKRYGVATRYYDPMAAAGIAELIGERTRAIFLESPGSLTMEVQDVPAICAAAKARGVATLLDNTWATPLFFPALAAGVDLSILAATKYVGGHADVMLGSVTANAQHYAKLERTGWDLGHSASPDDAWLCSRGLRTMGVRLRQHEASALRIARWLKDQPQVAAVLHPALPDCPGHEVWTRDFRGSSGLFSVVLRGGGDAERTRFIESLELFGLGYSWGGYESLVVPADPERIRTVTQWRAEGPLVRLHIGLEDVDDLIEDLAAGLARYGDPA
ncbi:MAG: cysteine-S-conjugate beta-lyase [Sphingomonadales bacterium]|jgi:cystathionine beta-lyase|nr:cysteine-S-conjugate beta-lyase [Sphingomonadales bacterium]